MASDIPETSALVSKSENLAGIDVFIGEANHLHKGLGPVFISKFIKDIIFSIPEIQSCMIDPEIENAAAIRAYEKIGFKYSHTVWDAKYGVCAYIMFLNRDDIRT
jgi:RimJ/RimL family protein N-acetyltransferase